MKTLLDLPSSYDAREQDKLDAARFRKLCALVDSVAESGGVWIVKSVDDQYRVHRHMEPEIDDRTHGTTLAEAIDNQPNPDAKL